MQYKEVETFLELVRTRNITRTAELLYVSQSTVSNRLKSLEDELACQLIVRTRGHRAVQLTRQGEEFVQIASRWKELFDETERLKSSSLSVLRIASGESSYYSWIAPFLRGFYVSRGDAKVTVRICDSDAVYRLVERNQIDFGFASYDSYREGVEIRCIDTQPLVVMRYCEHPEPGRVIHPRELDPSREIRFTGGFFAGMNAWHERWFGLDRSCPLEVNTSRGVAPLMEGTDYWAVSPIRMARELARTMSLQIYRLDEAPGEWKVFMLRRRDSQRGNPELCRAFESGLMDFIKQNRDKGEDLP